MELPPPPHLGSQCNFVVGDPQCSVRSQHDGLGVAAARTTVPAGAAPALGPLGCAWGAGRSSRGGILRREGQSEPGLRRPGREGNGDVGTATRVGTEPEVPKGAVGPGATTTSLGRMLRGGGRGWTLAVLAGAARPFPGLRGFPESVPVKMCLVTGPRSGELRSPQATAPEPVPVRDLQRGGLAHFAVCGFFGPRAGRL